MISASLWSDAGNYLRVLVALIVIVTLGTVCPGFLVSMLTTYLVLVRPHIGIQLLKALLADFEVLRRTLSEALANRMGSWKRFLLLVSAITVILLAIFAILEPHGLSWLANQIGKIYYRLLEHLSKNAMENENLGPGSFNHLVDKHLKPTLSDNSVVAPVIDTTMEVASEVISDVV